MTKAIITYITNLRRGMVSILISAIKNINNMNRNSSKTQTPEISKTAGARCVNIIKKIED